MIKLILTDMDGTLLNGEHNVPDQTVETIIQLKERGIRFGVASGREYENIRAYFPEFAEEMIFIADNGTLVYDGSEEIYVDCMETEAVIKIIEALRRIPNAWLVLCGKDLTYIECKQENKEAILAVAHNFYKNIVPVEDAVECAKQKEILELSIFCEKSAAEAAKQLEWVKEEHQLFVSGLNWIDILNKTAGKGNALKKIQARYGWKPEECMAFGDYLNDKAMLEQVGESYAMANAHPEILATAKYQAPSNEEGGVIRVIRERFGLDTAAGTEEIGK